jgi:hypothetical protein
MWLRLCCSWGSAVIDIPSVPDVGARLMLAFLLCLPYLPYLAVMLLLAFCYWWDPAVVDIPSQEKRTWPVYLQVSVSLCKFRFGTETKQIIHVLKVL